LKDKIKNIISETIKENKQLEFSLSISKGSYGAIKKIYKKNELSLFKKTKNLNLP